MKIPRLSEVRGRLVIRTPAQAEAVAQFIKADEGKCLDTAVCGNLHTLNCGYGKGCEILRGKIARALAVYYINTIVGRKK